MYNIKKRKNGDEMKLKNMKQDDRPRERLIHFGAEALTDYELLAIMLGSGSKEQSVIELSMMLIQEYGLNRLLRMNFMELKQIKGIKEAKASKLMSCFELAKRCIKKEEGTANLSTSKGVFEFCKSDYMFTETEKLMAIFVDCKCNVLHKIFLGQSDSSVVTVPTREIIRYGLSCNAFGVILVHNHPSGEIEPSRSDIEATKRIEEVLLEINIHLLDHLIVGGDKFFSFLDSGLLN